MDSRLLTPDELKEITGLATSNKQADWFQEQFKTNVVRSSGGRVIVTWRLFEALLARRAGLPLNGEPQVERRPALRPLFPGRTKDAG